MANLYWYPDATSSTGTGNWSATGATGHWATDAAGTGLGHAAPTSSDNVFFGSTSFNGAGQVVTVDTAANCLSMDWTGATNTPTLAISAASIFVYGNVTFIPTLQTVAGSFIYFNAATGTQTFTTAGLTTNFAYQANNGSTISIIGNLTVGAAGTASFYLSGSTLQLNGYTLTAHVRDGGATTNKTISMGDGVINTNGWDFPATGLTLNFTAGAVINNSVNIASTGITFPTMNLTSATSTITGNNTFTNLTFDASAAAAQTITLPASGTQTVSGTFTATGDSTANRCTIQSSSAGTSSTINAATVAVTKSDLKDLIGAGAGSWAMGASSDVRHVSGGSGITYRAFWSADTGNWSDYANKWATLSGGTTRLLAAPDSVTNVYFDALSFTAGQTVTVDASATCKDLSFVGTTNSPTLNAPTYQVLQIYGDATFISGMTITGDQVTFRFLKNGTSTLTTNGGSLPLVGIYSANTILSLADNLSLYRMYITIGTFLTNNKSVTASSKFEVADASAKTITLGSSVITCAALDMAAGGGAVTLTPNTSTINCSGNFTGGSKTTYNIVNLTGATSTITGNNTMNTLGLTRAGVQTITATGTTQTFKSLIRNAGNQVKTLVNGTYTRLPGGGVNLDYMSISGSTATTALYAGPLTHSTDGGGNTGWVFQCNPECRISRMRRYLAAGVV